MVSRVALFVKLKIPSFSLSFPCKMPYFLYYKTIDAVKNSFSFSFIVWKHLSKSISHLCSSSSSFWPTSVSAFHVSAIIPPSMNRIGRMAGSPNFGTVLKLIIGKRPVSMTNQVSPLLSFPVPDSSRWIRCPTRAYEVMSRRIRNWETSTISISISACRSISSAYFSSHSSIFSWENFSMRQ